MWAPGVVILVSHFHRDWSVSWCIQINLDLRFTHRKKKSVNRGSLSREAQTSLPQMPPLPRSFPWLSYVKQLSAGYSHSLSIFLFLSSCHLLLCKKQKQNKLQQPTEDHLFVYAVAVRCLLLEGKLHEDRELTCLVLWSPSSSYPALPLPCIQRK